MSEEKRLDLDVDVPEVYKQYRAKLATVGLGMRPANGDGKGWKFLSTCVPPEDAEVIVKMKYEWQTAAEYAEINGITEEEAEKQLYAASTRGGVYRKIRDDGTHLYAISNMAHGIWEFNVEKQTPEFVDDFMAGQAGQVNTFNYPDNPYPFFRTMPVSEKVLAKGEVLNEWDNIETYIRNASCINLWTCACCEAFRKGNGGERMNMRGDNVPPTAVEEDRPTETCMVLNDMAKYYTENGWGRQISVEEALAIKDELVFKYRLFPEVFNSKKAEVICFCDGKWCLTLPQRKFADFPEACTNYYLHKDYTKCTNCGKCVSRCCLGLHSYDARGKVLFNNKNCLACGQCVLDCPTDALKIYKKPDGDYIPPDDLMDQNRKMAEWSGRIEFRPFDPEKN